MISGWPSTTALCTLAARAAEEDEPTARRILEDPYAKAFIRALGLDLLPGHPLIHLMNRLGTLATFVVCRHRLIDDALLREIPAAEQVLSLGPGLDSRPIRFAAALGQRPYFEVNHPATLQRRRALLAAVPEADLPRRYRRVAVNFEEGTLAAELCAAGFIPGRPSVVLWEGVSYYLTRAAVAQTLAALATLCGPGSLLAFDVYDPAAALGGLRAQASAALRTVALRLLGEPLRSEVTQSSLALTLRVHGFKLEAWVTAEEMADRFLKGRPEARIYDAMPVCFARRV